MGKSKKLEHSGDATPDTPWWLTRLCRQRYYVPSAPDRSSGQGWSGYSVIARFDRAELDSDVWAVKIDHVVSVTLLSLDLTSRVSFGTLNACLSGETTACIDLPESMVFPLSMSAPVQW